MADDRWQPREHALVRVEPDDDQPDPPGTWQILSHGPTSPTSWWLMPISADAIRWATANAGVTVSRCIEIPGNRLRSNHTHSLNRGSPR